MNDSDWKEQIRENLELMKQGKTSVDFNADFYNELAARRKEKQQVADAERKTEADGKEVSR